MIPLRLKAGNKYGAKKTTVDGITFDSKAEAKRWQELKLLEKAGEIRGLARQMAFELSTCRPTCDGKTRLGVYICDFRYFALPTGECVIEDVKGGPIPALSAWKIKHFEAQYGMKVQIVRM